MTETSFFLSNFSQQIMGYPSDPQNISFFTNQCGYCKKKIYPKIDDIYMYKCVYFFFSFYSIICFSCFIVVRLKIVLLYHKNTATHHSVRKNVEKNNRKLTNVEKNNKKLTKRKKMRKY